MLKFPLDSKFPAGDRNKSSRTLAAFTRPRKISLSTEKFGLLLKILEVISGIRQYLAARQKATPTPKNLTGIKKYPIQPPKNLDIEKTDKFLPGRNLGNLARFRKIFMKFKSSRLTPIIPPELEINQAKP